MRISSRSKNKIKFNREHTNYTNSQGKYVPSVTTILKILSKGDALLSWSNNLGWKRISYKKELEQSSFIGDIVHSFCEYKINNDETILKRIDKLIETVNDYTYKAILNGITSFNKWYEKNKECIKPIKTELIMTCDDYGGTSDFICFYNNKRIMIDYKTSSHFYMTQFLQLAAYSLMYKEIYGKEIDDVAVLRLDKKNGNEGELLFLSSLPNGNLQYYQHIFKILVKLYKYYNVLDNDWSEYDSLIKSGILFK